MALSMMAGYAAAPVADSPSAELATSQSWSGDYPVADLKRLPERQQLSRVGYLGNPAVFKAVWSGFKPGEAVPEVDFGNNLVVFSRNVDFYNRTQIFKVTLKQGVAEVSAMETMSAIPVEDKVAMAVVPRTHVKSIRIGVDHAAVVVE